MELIREIRTLLQTMRVASQDLDDLQQEVLLAIVRRRVLQRFQAERGERRAYLYVVCRNIRRSFYRDRRTRPWQLDPPSTQVLPEPDYVTPLALQQVAKTPLDRRIITAYLAGYKPPEIAAQERVSRYVVWRRMCRMSQTITSSPPSWPTPQP